MKKNVFIAAAAAIVLTFSACQKDNTVVPGDNNATPAGNTDNTTVRVKTTSDLHNTDWTYTTTTAEFLSTILGFDQSRTPGLENDTMAFALNFDGTYAHFTFPGNIEAYSGDEGSMEQIYGVAYTYSYDGATHTGYLDGVAEDGEGNTVPVQLQFTYDDPTDAITFVLPIVNAEDSTSVDLTLVFHRDE